MRAPDHPFEEVLPLGPRVEGSEPPAVLAHLILDKLEELLANDWFMRSLVKLVPVLNHAGVEGVIKNAPHRCSSE